MSVTLRLIGADLSVCKLSDARQVDLEAGFYTLSVTGKEVSLVCETASAPASALQREKGFRAFEVMRQFDFTQTGIIAGISSALLSAKVGAFVISTFDTDYILVREKKLEDAIDALIGAGYSVVQ
jgi:hypothetical protein